MAIRVGKHRDARARPPRTTRNGTEAKGEASPSFPPGQPERLTEAGRVTFRGVGAAKSGACDKARWGDGGPLVSGGEKPCQDQRKHQNSPVMKNLVGKLSHKKLGLLVLAGLASFIPAQAAVSVELATGITQFTTDYEAVLSLLIGATIAFVVLKMIRRAGYGVAGA